MTLQSSLDLPAQCFSPSINVRPLYHLAECFIQVHRNTHLSELRNQMVDTMLSEIELGSVRERRYLSSGGDGIDPAR